MRFTLKFLLGFVLFIPCITSSYADDIDTKASQAVSQGYAVGIDDLLDISVLQPEKIMNTVPVAPDGSISFPYVGTIPVNGKTCNEIQDILQKKLSEGYMKYPVVVVSLRESHSKKFYVYGEVMKPGPYLLDENTTVLKAVSMAGGFTKYGSSQVKILRQRKKKPGYDALRVNTAGLMNGSNKDDILLTSGDIVVVSE